jgi:hypothetical protein
MTTHKGLIISNVLLRAPHASRASGFSTSRGISTHANHFNYSGFWRKNSTDRTRLNRFMRSIPASFEEKVFRNAVTIDTKPVLKILREQIAHETDGGAS